MSISPCAWKNGISEERYLSEREIVYVRVFFTLICEVSRFGQLCFWEKGGEGDTAGQGLGVVEGAIERKGCTWLMREVDYLEW